MAKIDCPYYYVGDESKTAFVRIGNESVQAGAIELKRLVLRGSNQTYDSLISHYPYENYSFAKFRSVYRQRTGKEMDMERRGSGFKKIKDDYRRAVNYRLELEPVFYNDTSSFWVTLYNLNYNVAVEEARSQKQLFENKINESMISTPAKKKILRLKEQYSDDM